MRIAFMGTPDFAIPTLRALLESKHEVVCVYTQPPRAKGRGGKVQRSPVHQLALDCDVKVLCPRRLNDSVKEFQSLELDLAVVAAYGLILPKGVLDAPRLGCWNVHASLLPRWRGASPIQRAIWSGDKKTGVCIMQMDEGLDTGAVLMRKEIQIGENQDAKSLSDELSKLGANMVIEGLSMDLSPTPQSQENASYAKLLTKADGALDWSKSAFEIDRQVRALTPWPGVVGDKNGIKILQAKPSEMTTDENSGILLDKHGNVACGDGGVLQVLKIQPIARKPMDIRAALNGGYVEIGKHV